jgi:hypothetical protein
LVRDAVKKAAPEGVPTPAALRGKPNGGDSEPVPAAEQGGEA